MGGIPTRDEAFCGLFTSHRDAIWSYCYRRLPSDEVADAVADVFLQAWRSLDRAPQGDERVLWLYGIARNVIRNTRRSDVRRQRLNVKARLVAQADVASPEVQVVQRSEERELRDAVERLSPLEQELLRLRTWEELSLSEIATVTGMTTRAVESRLARVRKRLASMLDGPPVGFGGRSGRVAADEGSRP